MLYDLADTELQDTLKFDLPLKACPAADAVTSTGTCTDNHVFVASNTASRHPKGKTSAQMLQQHWENTMIAANNLMGSVWQGWSTYEAATISLMCGAFGA